MKKISVLLLAIVMTFIATGCMGSKKLVCTNQEKEDGMTANMTMTVNFKNDLAANMNMDIKMTLDDKYKSYMSMFKETIKSQYSKYEKSGMKLDIDSKDNQLSVKLSADFEKMSSSDKKSLGFSSSDNSYKAVKKSLEAEGYSCK